MADLRKKPNKKDPNIVSDSTDNYKKFEDMTISEKIRAAAEKIIKEKQKKDSAGDPFNPNIGDASTDDPKLPKPLGGRPVSPGSDGATETIKPDSDTQKPIKMKRRNDGSIAKLKDQSFMKRMKMMNQASPTKLIEGEHDSVFDILKNKPIGTTKSQRDKIKNITKTIYDKIKNVSTSNKFPYPGTISDDLSDKIRKSGKIRTTPTYAPENRSGTGIFNSPNPLDAGINLGKTITTKIGNKISDLFGR
jgi:hypothetical protein